MHYQVLTIFPELFEPLRHHGLTARAIEQNLIRLQTTQLRNYAINTQGQIDDTPYGGGSGMVLRCESAVAAINDARTKCPGAKVVLLSPRGTPFNSKLANELSQNEGLILLPYRYEGVDQRINDHYVDLEVSMGDFVLMGGEVAAMAVIEATSRFIPGVLGNPESTQEESFQNNLLEYPQYTKPREFEGHTVPEVLLSGDHARIEEFRKEQSHTVTKMRRPELLGNQAASCNINVALIHHPVLNKEGKVVTSSITNLDVHDIARSAKTYGVSNYYVVHPTKTMRRLIEKICEHWDKGYGSTYNPNRKDALSTIDILPDFDDVLRSIEMREGMPPKIIVTSAKDAPGVCSYAELRAELATTSVPHLILFGTGWGMTDDLMQRADYRLAPIEGFTEYNHLSVRAAAAITMDRLLGRMR